jgi:hypothetical protein
MEVYLDNRTRAIHGRQPRRAADEPGTLGQQLEILGLYWANPARQRDCDRSWNLARRLVLPHARRAAA